MTEEIRNTIDDILDELDVERIHSIMELCNWKWAVDPTDIKNSNMEIPDTARIRKTARNLLKSVVEKAEHNGEACFTSCGGLAAEAFFEQSSGKLLMSIRFIPVESDNYYESDEITYHLNDV